MAKTCSLELAVLTFAFCWLSTRAIVVKIQNGELQGTNNVSRANVPYFSFCGIPFAKPPVNELRFQDPQSPEPWSGVRDATDCQRYRECMQPQSGEIKGSEDCLYLNVYTPQVDKPGLPVLVWIHGGGFREGTALTHGPDYFMDRPVVLVTINYRLGALGFLHLDDEILPGNYGVKDQVEALRWIRNNIGAFGGDINRVTLCGQSSGGAAVHWHMFSPASKGLFHRVISQSGTAMASYAEVPKRLAKDRGLMMARLLGCNYESAREMVNCLKRIPALDLLKTQEKFMTWSYHPISFSPVPQNEGKPVWDSQTLDPNVQLLIGFTTNEKQLDIAGLLKNGGHQLDYLSENYQMILPLITQHNVHPKIQTDSQMNEITEKLRQFYFKNETIGRQTLTPLENLWVDGRSLYDITEAALRHQGTRYFYVYDHLPEHSLATLVNKDFKPTGPVHCDELITLFKFPQFPQELNSADRRVSEIMLNMWVNFMSTGDPNSADLGFQWLPLKSHSKIEHYLSITEHPEMKTHWYWEDRYSFWRSLNLHNECSAPTP